MRSTNFAFCTLYREAGEEARTFHLQKCKRILKNYIAKLVVFRENTFLVQTGGTKPDFVKNKSFWPDQ